MGRFRAGSENARRSIPVDGKDLKKRAIRKNCSIRVIVNERSVINTSFLLSGRQYSFENVSKNTVAIHLETSSGFVAVC